MDLLASQSWQLTPAHGKDSGPTKSGRSQLTSSPNNNEAPPKGGASSLLSKLAGKQAHDRRARNNRKHDTQGKANQLKNNPDRPNRGPEHSLKPRRASHLLKTGRNNPQNDTQPNQLHHFTPPLNQVHHTPPTQNRTTKELAICLSLRSSGGTQGATRCAPAGRRSLSQVPFLTPDCRADSAPRKPHDVGPSPP